MDKIIKIYTDGACSGNPGKGGCAYVATEYPYAEVSKANYIRTNDITTNNRMEMMAIVMAMEYFDKVYDKSYRLEILSDSALLCNSFNQSWYINWERNGWKNSKKQPVANQDLWALLLPLYRKLNPIITKVKGHSGNKFNCIADALATGKPEEARRYGYNHAASTAKTVVRVPKDITY